MANRMLIYKISNTVNDKVYIGQTIRSLSSRLQRHFGDARKNKGKSNCCKLQRAINKYGEDKFSIEEIDEAFSKEELNQKEKLWILKFNSVKDGYNTSTGGDGGNTYSGLSKSRINDIRQKISKANSGSNNGMSKPVKAKNAITGEEYFFDTLASCLEFFNIQNKGFITSRAKHQTNILWKNEWMFAFQDDDYAQYVKFDPSTRSGKPVKLTSIVTGETINFPSKMKALKFLGIRYASLISGMEINGFKVLIP